MMMMMGVMRATAYTQHMGIVTTADYSDYLLMLACVCTRALAGDGIGIEFVAVHTNTGVVGA